MQHSDNKQSPKSKQHGFSLIELMITIATVAILSGLAIPSFASLIAQNRIDIQSQAIFESLYLARSYAISQHNNVHICHLAQNTQDTCSKERNYNSSWSQGWLVFADVNNNNNYDTDDQLLRVIQTDGITNIVFNQRGRLRFFPNGSARSAGFYLCSNDKKHYRHVYLLYSGRARTSEKLSDKQKLICDAA